MSGEPSQHRQESSAFRDEISASLTSRSEEGGAVADIGRPETDFPRTETVSRLFARQAAASAGAIAVRGPDDRTSSYGELETASNRLAGVLRVARGR